MRVFFFMLLGICSVISLPIYADTFTLSSQDIINAGSDACLTYSCDGKDISPDLEWTDAPAHTQTYALILSDVDAPGGIFYHWVVYNIPKTVSSLPSAVDKLPAGSVTGKNSWDHLSYKGPCPPKGATHHYIFSLYALDTALHLSSKPDAESVLKAMQNHVLGEAELKATFGH